MRNRLRTSDWFAKGFGGAMQLALGYPCMRGVTWPYSGTRIVLVRRKLYPGAVGDWRPAGMAQDEETEIRNFEGFLHGADTGWEYTAAVVYPNGMRSDYVQPVRVDFDGAGDIISPGLPTWPRAVDVVPGPAGVYVVSWHYETWGQAVFPTDFEVYEGADVDSIDYDTPLGTETYDATALEYQYTTGAYGDGTLHAFAVRSRNSGSVAEKNEYTTEVIPAEAATPNAAEISSAIVRSAGG